MQTAVEWLVEELNQKIHIIPMDKWDKIRDLVQKAKEMEKQQIIDAYRSGKINQLENSEIYYNETFKKD